MKRVTIIAYSVFAVMATFVPSGVLLSIKLLVKYHDKPWKIAYLGYPTMVGVTLTTVLVLAAAVSKIAPAPRPPTDGAGWLHRRMYVDRLGNVHSANNGKGTRVCITDERPRTIILCVGIYLLSWGVILAGLWM